LATQNHQEANQATKSYRLSQGKEFTPEARSPSYQDQKVEIHQKYKYLF
jgi:hypothetical protein